MTATPPANVVDQIRTFGDRMDRIVEVALAANLELDLAIAGPQTVISVYAVDGPDPTLPIRACMTANVTMRFIQIYGLAPLALQRASHDVTAALKKGVLSELPTHRYSLEDIVAAHEAVEHRAVGKVLVDLTES